MTSQDNYASEHEEEEDVEDYDPSLDPEVLAPLDCMCVCFCLAFFCLSDRIFLVLHSWLLCLFRAYFIVPPSSMPVTPCQFEISSCGMSGDLDVITGLGSLLVL